MKKTTIALSIGFIVVALGLLGLVTGETQLAGGMNTDLPLDLARVALGAFLIIGGFKSAEASRTALTVFGIAYIGMFLFGLVSPSLFGLLPHELGWIDQTLHVVGGGAAVFLAMTGVSHKAAV